jgi:type 1 glutamine amidotransferase
MNRREMLLSAGAAAIGLSAFPLRWTAAADQKKKQKILYFTRSAGFVHPPVEHRENRSCVSDLYFSQECPRRNLEVVCSRDGAVFDGDLEQFDGFVFYTSGDLTGNCATPQPGQPMSQEGKKRLLAAIEAGKGFLGIHSATDTFRGEGIDPFIAMLGGEFINHGAQQTAKMQVVSPKFPGMEKLGKGFSLHEEWYALHKFAKDLHVILVQDTDGMKGDMYWRPPYPATWARMHGRGRVFYTSMGHDKIWANDTFHQVLWGGMAWMLGNAQADVSPNIAQVTPHADQLKRQ